MACPETWFLPAIPEYIPVEPKELNDLWLEFILMAIDQHKRRLWQSQG